MRKLWVGFRSIILIFTAAGFLFSCASPRTRDIRFFVETIERNYPYLGVHKRMEGLDWAAYKKTLSPDKYENLGESDYRRFLASTFRSLNGHVGLVSDGMFSYMHPGFMGIAEGSVERRKYAPWQKALEKTKARNIYTLIEIPKPADAAGRIPGLDIECRAIGDAAYIRVPIFDADRVERDGVIIADFLAANPALSKLVIDIRGNGGGSDSYWTKNLVGPFIEKTVEFKACQVFRGGRASMPFVRAQVDALLPIRKLPTLANEAPELRKDFRWFGYNDFNVEPSPTRMHRFSKTIVLMDGANFSASETFVSFCKSTGYATLVGERSGGDGIGFDVILIELPASHLLMCMPAVASLNADGSFNYETGTEPDVPAKGKDALELALRL